MNQEFLEIYGIILVILTATQFFGQVVKSFRTKSTKDLSWWTFIITFVISALWVIFGIWRGAGEIVAANATVNVSCIAILATKYFVERPKISLRLIFSSPAKMVIAIFAVGLMVLVIAAIARPLLREILGWVTVALNVGQLVPQAIKSLVTKSTRDLSWWTFLQIFVISIMWTLYGVWNGLYEVIAANALVNIICDAILVRKYLSEEKH